MRQTVAANPPTPRTITVSADLERRAGPLNTVQQRIGAAPTVPPTVDRRDHRHQLHADFDHGPVSLTPAGTDWSSMTTPFTPLHGTLPGTGGTPVKIEITERQPLGPQMRLLSGAPPRRLRHAGPVVTQPGAKPHAIRTGKPTATAPGQPAATLQVGHDQADGGNVRPARGLDVRDARRRLASTGDGHPGHRPGHGNRGPGRPDLVVLGHRPGVARRRPPGPRGAPARTGRAG